MYTGRICLGAASCRWVNVIIKRFLLPRFDEGQTVDMNQGEQPRSVGLRLFESRLNTSCEVKPTRLGQPAIDRLGAVIGRVQRGCGECCIVFECTIDDGKSNLPVVKSPTNIGCSFIGGDPGVRTERLDKRKQSCQTPASLGGNGRSRTKGTRFPNGNAFGSIASVRVSRRGSRAGLAPERQRIAPGGAPDGGVGRGIDDRK